MVSVDYHYRKWCKDKTWQRINREMVFLENRRIGRFARPVQDIMDSQSIKFYGFTIDGIYVSIYLNPVVDMPSTMYFCPKTKNISTGI